MVTWSTEHVERWCLGSCTLNPPLLPSWGMRTSPSLFWGAYGKEGSSSPSSGPSHALAQADLPLQQSSAWLPLKLEKQLLNVEKKSHGGGVRHKGTSAAGSTPRGCEASRAEQQEQK